MSTGAPLNLPKPKGTTNTGQDLIEIGNSLQKINDAIGDSQANLGTFEVVANAYSVTASQPLSVSLAGGLYQITAHTQTMQAPTNSAFVAVASVTGSTVYLTPIRSSEWLSAESSGSTLTVIPSSYAWRVAVLKL